MKYTIQDIKRWGFIKIYQYYMIDNNLLDDILAFNIENNNIKASPYSLLREYDDLNKNYWGIKCLINDIEPFNELVEISDYQKRRFRNTWNSLFNNFASCANLEAYKAQAISEFGIRLALIKYNEKYDKIIEFYNAVISWNKIITNNIEFREDISLIDVMVTYDRKDFIEFMLKEVRK